jgi:hypothetical protein
LIPLFLLAVRKFPVMARSGLASLDVGIRLAADVRRVLKSDQKFFGSKNFSQRITVWGYACDLGVLLRRIRLVSPGSSAPTTASQSISDGRVGKSRVRSV